MPVILARAGMPVSATRRHDDVWQRAPFSMSRYGPNGAMNMRKSSARSCRGQPSHTSRPASQIRLAHLAAHPPRHAMLQIARALFTQRRRQAGWNTRGFGAFLLRNPLPNHGFGRFGLSRVFPCAG